MKIKLNQSKLKQNKQNKNKEAEGVCGKPAFCNSESLKATLDFASLLNGRRCRLALRANATARDTSAHTAGRITAAAARRFAGTPARPATFRC